jgi:hypothetical protein
MARSLAGAFISTSLTSTGARWKSAPTDGALISSPPARFRRATGMLALPVPEPGGSIDQAELAYNPSSANRVHCEGEQKDGYRVNGTA